MESFKDYAKAKLKSRIHKSAKNHGYYFKVENCRALFPRRSYMGNWIFPGQRYWRCMIGSTVIRESGDPFKSSAMWQQYIYISLTDEEYVMIKMTEDINMKGEDG